MLGFGRLLCQLDPHQRCAGKHAENIIQREFQPARPWFGLGSLDGVKRELGGLSLSHGQPFCFFFFKIGVGGRRNLDEIRHAFGFAGR